jgi:hypothetical protein
VDAVHGPALRPRDQGGDVQQHDAVIGAELLQALVDREDVLADQPAEATREGHQSGGVVQSADDDSDVVGAQSAHQGLNAAGGPVGHAAGAEQVVQADAEAGDVRS